MCLAADAVDGRRADFFSQQRIGSSIVRLWGSNQKVVWTTHSPIARDRCGVVHRFYGPGLHNAALRFGFGYLMNIYCGNLAYSMTSDSLRAAFEAHGEVSSANVITDRDTGRSKGFGFVEMPNDAEGQAAIDAINGTDLEGRPARVNEARPRPAGGGGGGGRRY